MIMAILSLLFISNIFTGKGLAQNSQVLKCAANVFAFYDAATACRRLEYNMSNTFIPASDSLVAGIADNQAPFTSTLATCANVLAASTFGLTGDGDGTTCLIDDNSHLDG
jgi:hypothetical protein